MRHMNLREEDHQLLLHLHDFIYLHKQFIEKYIFKSYSGHHSIYRRLRDLENAGYIKSFFLQVEDSDHRASKVFTLTRFGVDTVEQLRGIVHWNVDWTTRPAVWYKHQLMIAESVKSYETKAGAVGLEVKEWIPEPRAFYNFPLTGVSAKKTTAIRPDGIVVMGRPDSREGFGFMIEMERSYSTKERTIRKIDQYNEFFSRSEELLDPYKRKVAFEADVKFFKIIFIGGTEAKTEKLLRDLANENSLAPILVASRQDVESNPFGTIYRDTRQPEKFINL